MPAVTSLGTGGPGEQPSHESVINRLDEIFDNPSIPSEEVILFGLRWSRKGGWVNAKDVPAMADSAPDPRDWHGARVDCLRSMENGATRIEARFSGVIVGAWVYGSDSVYRLNGPNGAECFDELTGNQTHYGMLYFVLAHTTELNPG